MHFSNALVPIVLWTRNLVVAQNGCDAAVNNTCTSRWSTMDIGVQASVCAKVVCQGSTTGSEAFKRRIVDSHNEHRLKSFTNGSFGGDMMKLTWDDQLATAAMGWANILCSSNKFIHDRDECRTTTRYPSIGQNLMTGSGARYASEIDTVDDALRMWYDEIHLMTPDRMFPFEWTPLAGHYTSMVWSRSYRIGCAYIKIPDNTLTAKAWIVCDYAPSGNVIGGKFNVFNPSSAPATDCMPGTAKGASGLCEVINEDQLLQHLALSGLR